MVKPTDPALEARNVSRRYKSSGRGVEDASFSVDPGEVFAKADELLLSCPTLRTYVVPERREPILIFRRDRPRLRKLIDDDERVDLDLASSAIRLRAGDLRRWSASKPMLEALDAVARHDLVSSHS